MVQQNNNDLQSVENFLSENIPDIEALLITDKKGNIIKHRVSSKYEKDYDASWLKFFSKLISVRFPISDFHKQLSGLKMTVNVFKEKTVIVKMLENDQILIVIIPWKTTSVINALNIMHQDVI